MNRQKNFRGIFPILHTPFLPDGSLDLKSLRREVEFCVRAGCHGVVVPALASEVTTLLDSEREALIATAVEQVAGRVPVVAGVSGPSREAVLYHARRAGELGADAVMAMPPLVSPPGPEEVVRFYHELADGTGLPVIVQNAGPPWGVALPVETLARIVGGHPARWFVKEEVHPAGIRMSHLLSLAGDALEGVFGGAGGLRLLAELRRGACGSMPGAFMADAWVRVYESWQRGDEAEAERLYRRLLPLAVFRSDYPFRVAKMVLQLRDVIEHAVVRRRGDPEPDSVDIGELEALLKDLSDLMPPVSLD